MTDWQPIAVAGAMVLAGELLASSRRVRAYQALPKSPEVMAALTAAPLSIAGGTVKAGDFSPPVHWTEAGRVADFLSLYTLHERQLEARYGGEPKQYCNLGGSYCLTFGGAFVPTAPASALSAVIGVWVSLGRKVIELGGRNEAGSEFNQARALLGDAKVLVGQLEAHSAAMQFIGPIVYSKNAEAWGQLSRLAITLESATSRFEGGTEDRRAELLDDLTDAGAYGRVLAEAAGWTASRLGGVAASLIFSPLGAVVVIGGAYYLARRTLL